MSYLCEDCHEPNSIGRSDYGCVCWRQSWASKKASPNPPLEVKQSFPEPAKEKMETPTVQEPLATNINANRVYNLPSDPDQKIQHLLDKIFDLERKYGGAIENLRAQVKEAERVNAMLVNKLTVEISHLKDELRSKDNAFGQIATLKKNIADTLIDVNAVAARADKRWSRLAQALREDAREVYATQPIPPMSEATKRFIAGPPKSPVHRPPPISGFGAKPAVLPSPGFGYTAGVTRDRDGAYGDAVQE